MAVTRFACPACSASLRMNGEPPPGRKVKCPKCGVPFAPGAKVVAEAVKAAPPAREAGVHRHADNRSQVRSARPRYRPQRRQKSYTALIVGLVAAFLFVAVGAVVAVVLVRANRKADASVASVPATTSGNVPIDSGRAQPSGRNEQVAPRRGSRDEPPPEPPIPPNDTTEPREPTLPTGSSGQAGSAGPNVPAMPPGTVGPNRPTPPAQPSKPSRPTLSGRPGLEIGDNAMEIGGQDIDGKKFKLSDYRGKVVVLDFWGNW